MVGHVTGECIEMADAGNIHFHLDHMFRFRVAVDGVPEIEAS